MTGTIDEKGGITWSDIVVSTEKNTETEVLTAEQIAQNPKKYYGQQVINYKANDEDTNVYRIFYVDEDNYFGDGEYTVYLKADSFGWIDYQISYNKEKTKFKQMNHEYISDNFNKELGPSWLCNPTVEEWSKYCNNSYANYVIGAPSIEMYVKSYNQTHDKDKNGNNVLEYLYEVTGYRGYNYKVYGVETEYR